MASYAKLLLFIVIVMAVVIPMMIKGPNGKPIMALDDWIPRDAVANSIGQVTSLGRSLEHSAKQAVNAVSDQGELLQTESSASRFEVKPLAPNQMYKWKDKSGNWQFSNQKPVDASFVQIEDLPEVKNVMDATIIRRNNSSTIGLPEGLSLENAGELLEKVGLSNEKQK